MAFWYWFTFVTHPGVERIMTVLATWARARNQIPDDEGDAERLNTYKNVKENT